MRRRRNPGTSGQRRPQSTHRLPGPHLAARFAAKEAIAKAFGTGIGSHLGWHDMEVGRKESGEPYVRLHQGGLKLLQARQGAVVHLSLTHTQAYAAAVAIIEGDQKGQPAANG